MRRCLTLSEVPPGLRPWRRLHKDGAYCACAGLCSPAAAITAGTDEAGYLGRGRDSQHCTGTCYRFTLSFRSSSADSLKMLPNQTFSPRRKPSRTESCQLTHSKQLHVDIRAAIHLLITASVSRGPASCC